MIAAILGIIVLIIILFVIATSGSTPLQGTVVPPQQCADRTVQYINTYLVQPGYEVSQVSVRETSGLYEMQIAFQSQEIPLYTSRDCTLLFQNPSSINTASAALVSPQQCADSAVQYVNTYLVQPGYEVSLVSVQETGGLYKMIVDYQSASIPLYASRDCSLLFQNPLDMNAPRATPAPTKAPIKTARPVVELYTMSFCPYGTQAVTALRPVYDLLESRADIRVRYITTIYGESVDSVDSLHGATEVQEDLYQVCVMKEEEEHSWEYLRLFNEQCYPLWQDPVHLETCRANVTATLGIDTVSVSKCTSGADGIALLRADATDSVTRQAWSSPTLLINGIPYRGARTPEAYKQAVCNSFEVAPPECNTVLSSASSSGSTGGCG